MDFFVCCGCGAGAGCKSWQFQHSCTDLWLFMVAIRCAWRDVLRGAAAGFSWHFCVMGFLALFGNYFQVWVLDLASIVHRQQKAELRTYAIL